MHSGAHAAIAATRRRGRQCGGAAKNPGNLALGHRHHDRLDPDQRPAASTLTRRKPAQRPRRAPPRGPWNPRHPARQPEYRHTAT
jgi:hypothetical protein